MMPVQLQDSGSMGAETGQCELGDVEVGNSGLNKLA